jgi:membrane-associated phospholipid phosphatase
METLLDLGTPITIFLQSIGDWFITFMKFFTFLGNEEFFLTLLPAIYWCWNINAGIRVGSMLLVSGSVNTYFKWIFHSPRPYWTSAEIKAFSSETSFGPPSGHTQNAVTVWGVFAASIQQRWSWIVAIVLMFMIGISRIALGVHSVFDVIMGWLIGGLLLWVFLRLEKPLIEWFKPKGTAMKVAILFGISLFMITLGILIRLPIADFQIPGVWIDFASKAYPEGESIDPLSLSGLVSNAAVLVGLGAGAVWMQVFGGFNPGGDWGKRALRYVLGVIGVLVIWRGLDVIFPDGENLVALVFRYLRYGLVGLWVSALGPLVFLRLNLAEPAQKPDNVISADPS